MRFIAGLLMLCVLLVGTTARALDVVKVDDNVYALVGELGQRSPTNLANNATFGVVVTDAGVVLIDAGGSARGAQEIEAAITKITEKKVVAVINTGGQDHRWLGNAHWKAKGARLISSKAAVTDQRSRFDMQWMGLEQLVGKEPLAGTQPHYADETFDDKLDLVIGGVTIALRHPGRAHTPGDLFVWLPDRKIAFAGDIVFTERMLGILPAPLSTSADWLKAFDVLAALSPKIVVPGHGRPGSLERAKSDTRDYLSALRDGVKAVLDRKGDMTAAAKIDQSAFARLVGADQLSGRNAQAVFAEMEFD